MFFAQRSHNDCQVTTREQTTADPSRWPNRLSPDDSMRRRLVLARYRVNSVYARHFWVLSLFYPSGAGTGGKLPSQLQHGDNDSIWGG